MGRYMKSGKIGKIVFSVIILCLVFSIVNSQGSFGDEGQDLSECEKAGGKITRIKECDNSESDWCIISEKEGCYADQVKNGRCAVVNISPRVLCDKNQ